MHTKPKEKTLRKFLNLNAKVLNTLSRAKYEVAIKNSGCKVKLDYKSGDKAADVHNRARKILSFTPPFNIAIVNKIKNSVGIYVYIHTVLQYFYNMRYNLAALNSFTVVMKVINHTTVF